ncbi:MAG TPA: hypothetical protein VFA18_17830 [Gemmataceae bacterium]|nr:hypothetical protein [Gemmataceae bacterium]
MQALRLEHALLRAQQLHATDDAAPDGQVRARLEARAVPAARPLARQAQAQMVPTGLAIQSSSSCPLPSCCWTATTA